MDQARQEPDSRKVLEILAQYRAPDSVFDREKELLTRLATLNLAEASGRDGKAIYAASLLEDLGVLDGGYCAGELERRRLLLLAQVKPQLMDEVCENLPSLDGELMLRAKSALNRGDDSRAGAFLDAAEKRDESWYFLRGQAYLAGQDYENALRCFRVAEAAYVDSIYPLMEACARELEDYKLAYEYACKQK